MSGRAVQHKQLEHPYPLKIKMAETPGDKELAEATLTLSLRANEPVMSVVRRSRLLELQSAVCDNLPVKWAKETFGVRYAICLPHYGDRSARRRHRRQSVSTPPAARCQALCDALAVDKAHYLLGRSVIFLNSKAANRLNALRTQKIAEHRRVMVDLMIALTYLVRRQRARRPLSTVRVT